MQVYSLISSLKTYHSTLHFTPLVTGPAHWCAISTQLRTYSPAAISAHYTYRTHCHLCPTWYSFSPEFREAFEGEVPCLRTQHRNNVPRSRGEKHDFSLKVLQQAGFKTARQEAALSKRHALTIAAMSLSMKIYISLFCNIWTIISMYRIHHPNLSTGRYLCCPPKELLVRPHHDKIDDAKLKSAYNTDALNQLHGFSDFDSWDNNMRKL